MSILLVIPAKSDSNRLKNKNMSKIGNKTLIQIAVEYAKKSKLIDNIVVSTDSIEISEYVTSNKLCEALIRTKGLSGDAEVFEVYKDTWNLCGGKHDYIIGLQPDNPDRKLILDDVINYVQKNNFDDFFTVSDNGNKNGAIRMFKNNLESINNPKIGTLLDNCTNVHSENDLAIANLIYIKNDHRLHKGVEGYQ